MQFVFRFTCLHLPLPVSICICLQHASSIFFTYNLQGNFSLLSAGWLRIFVFIHEVRFCIRLRKLEAHSRVHMLRRSLAELRLAHNALVASADFDTFVRSVITTTHPLETCARTHAAIAKMLDVHERYAQEPPFVCFQHHGCVCKNFDASSALPFR